jgi:uncharacterized SAM-binding protein YcdF (DUF218 family)
MRKFSEKMYVSALSPSNALIIIVLTAVLFQAITPSSRVIRVLDFACSAVIILLCLVPLGGVLLNGLQMRFPRFSPDGEPVFGIIVLGGVLSGLASPDSTQWAPTGAVARLFEAAKLAGEYPNARVLVSAGPEHINGGASEADGIAKYLVAMGVNADRLTLERRSRDTFENAQFSYAEADPKPAERWLLVTSAYHMPRAIGCFRKVGFDVVAAPADRQMRPRLGGWSVSRNLTKLDLATKEYLGLSVYWILGRTSAFMARP